MSDHRIELRVNGRAMRRMVEARVTLAELLREEFGLTAVHVGCAQGSCGACTVRIDGRVARSCLLLAVQADRTEIETPEGYAKDATMDRLRASFAARNAVQCGFCTGGMLVAARQLLERNPAPSRGAIREAISGHICRCTGYEAIVDAIEAAAATGTGAGR